MRIVALRATLSGDRLIEVRLLDRLSRDIVAFQAEFRLALNQIEDTLGLVR